MGYLHRLVDCRKLIFQFKCSEYCDKYILRGHHYTKAQANLKPDVGWTVIIWRLLRREWSETFIMVKNQIIGKKGQYFRNTKIYRNVYFFIF